MNNFTTAVNEVRKKYDSESLLQSEITVYINKVNKYIPVIVKDAIQLTKKYNLLDRDSIEEIKNSSKGSLKKLSTKYNIKESELEDLWKLLKDLKHNIKLLPQMMSPQEREMLELGKLSMDDLTIDLDSQNGRNAASKMYMPMIYKIVNQYIGKSNLSKSELISAALEGFTNAMNDWDKDSGTPFKTYAGTRARQQILNDINKHSHNLSGYNDYALKQGYSADAFSLDNIVNGDDDMQQDRLSFLGGIDDEYKEVDEQSIRKLYDLIEQKFSDRDIDIFYRYFALNGRKKEKSKDIAKMYGMSEGNIKNSIINKIIKFLRTDPKSASILRSIQESYNISLMTQLVGESKEYILESLVEDDMYILLEELNPWGSKQVFKKSLDNSLSSLNKTDCDKILKLISDDFEQLDSNFKKYKKLIILFLSDMYPTEVMNTKTDVALLDYMANIQELYKLYIKK
jgi:RNA polymerase sigma factor (sigma-70 family)